MHTWSGLWSGTTAVVRWIAGFFSRTTTAVPAPQVVYALLVADDIVAAKSVLRTMAISWERFGSSHRKAGPEIVFRIEQEGGLRLGDFKFSAEASTARTEPFSERDEAGYLNGRHEQEVLDGSFELAFSTLPDGTTIPRTIVVMRLVGCRYFKSERVGAAAIAALVRDLDRKWRASLAPAGIQSTGGSGQSGTSPMKLVILGITDASLQSEVASSVGSGVDQVLSPSLLRELSGVPDIDVRHRALVITGLERDFARFNPRDKNWSKYASARQAAWDPELIRGMLASVLGRRWHLRTLLENDNAFRGSSEALTVTAVMPCGFLNNWGCANYNAWNPGWIIGGPWIREEKEAPEVVPHHCADALLTALTHRVSEFQVTTHDLDKLDRMASDATGRRRYNPLSIG